ncbi:MAG: thioredoxin family protein [Methanobacteriota archaeon]
MSAATPASVRGAVPKLDAAGWQDAVSAQIPAVILFEAPWCVWCGRLGPDFEALSSEFEGLARFFRVDVDEEAELAVRHGVQGLPTIKFFCQAREVGSLTGFRSLDALRHEVAHALDTHSVCVAGQSPIRT